MTRKPRVRTGIGWLALFTLPALCCIGHLVLLTAGLGSLTALAGATAGSDLLLTAGLALPAGVAAVVLYRRSSVARSERSSRSGAAGSYPRPSTTGK